jgi:hypothetical protein
MKHVKQKHKQTLWERYVLEHKRFIDAYNAWALKHPLTRAEKQNINKGA